MFASAWKKAGLFYFSRSRDRLFGLHCFTQHLQVLTVSYVCCSPVIHMDLCLLPDCCKPELCQVKFIFLMSLILRFLIFWSCLKPVITRTIFSHQKCKSNLNKNVVHLLWLQLRPLLFSFTKWICFYFESFIIWFKQRWQTYILKSKETYGTRCLVLEAWWKSVWLIFSFYGWNIAWEYERNLTCKGNPSEIKIIK